MAASDGRAPASRQPSLGALAWAEAPLCLATVIALSSSDIAPREEGILGIKATK